MRTLRFALVLLALLALFPVLQPSADAGTGFYLNFATAHPGYHSYYRTYWPRYHYSYYPRYYPGYFYGWAAYHPYYTGGAYYGYGEVRAEVKPQTAKVFVDGDYVGVADDFDGWWQSLPLEPGKHRLVFREAGFAPYAVTLRILPGESYHIKYTLQQGDDNISDQDMRADRDRGHDRDDYDRNYRNEDQYQNRDRNYDQRRPSERSRDEYRGPAEQDHSGQRELTLQIQPGDATIYVDGNYYGTGKDGGVRVRLTNGSHRIEVVRPGYQSFEKDIQVNENSVSSMTIMLEKK